MNELGQHAFNDSWFDIDDVYAEAAVCLQISHARPRDLLGAIPDPALTSVHRSYAFRFWMAIYHRALTGCSITEVVHRFSFDRKEFFFSYA